MGKRAAENQLTKDDADAVLEHDTVDVGEGAVSYTHLTLPTTSRV